MNLQARKQLLYDYKLDADDFYVVTEKFGDKILMRRTGIDKLAKLLKVTFTYESIITVPYGTKCCTTIVMKGTMKDGDWARVVSSANPDNCSYSYLAETAEKRAQHRLVLKLARLYEYDVFSEFEDEKWIESKNNYQDAVYKVEKALEKKNGQK
jgi:hypothetical protein